MKTQVKVIDPSTITFSTEDIEDPKFDISDPNVLSILNEAVDLLKKDKVIAMPTETVYGLAACAISAQGVNQIFSVKNRPPDNPLIVHISSLKMLRSLLPTKKNGEIGEIPEIYEPIIKKFWPGPLTILVPKSILIPSEITCNLSTVAVRFPSHPIARALISLCGFPLAAPSANTSGKPSPTLASHVLTDLNGKIPLIIDGGQCNFGVESTVFDAIGSYGPVILRPGGITYEALSSMPGMENLRVYKKDFVDKKLEIDPTTPGMKYRHYSPNAEVILVDVDDNNKSREIMEKEIKRIRKNGKITIGLLATRTSYTMSEGENETIESTNIARLDGSDTRLSRNIIEYTLGDSTHPEQIAKELFKGLRYLDEHNVDYIIVEGISEEEEGLAVMNRLRKAASRIISE
ncbi:DHBP synthase RibB-like alpha/beta domain-containing protein [Glomus cerebriforme]|uniref:Threonylcarbamoyl-AMP synthase n=1 Tax=Glomus cerebriforme TaxID=658196 RepID=A0A397TN22_9GLOM|nr:DHBP synthase RibB-like alpha/beta domain-containing protein [Glomus cerebriforme]